MRNEFTIAVDFDGTVVDHAYPKVGKPAPFALRYLQEWQEAGAQIILWTMRSDDALQDAVNLLKAHGIKLFGVNNNPTQKEWTNSPKAYAQIYVDDAAFGAPLIHHKDFLRPCIDWEIVGPQVLRKIRAALSLY